MERLVIISVSGLSTLTLSVDESRLDVVCERFLQGVAYDSKIRHESICFSGVKLLDSEVLSRLRSELAMILSDPGTAVSRTWSLVPYLEVRLELQAPFMLTAPGELVLSLVAVGPTELRFSMAVASTSVLDGG